jgi:hypothetical protein
MQRNNKRFRCFLSIFITFVLLLKIITFDLSEDGFYGQRLVEVHSTGQKHHTACWNWMYFNFKKDIMENEENSSDRNREKRN